jgi:hypothetical protein
METLEDVINWFQTNPFIINPLLTIAIIGGLYYAPRILAILIHNNKNEKKTRFISRASYVSYLRED